MTVSFPESFPSVFENETEFVGCLQLLDVLHPTQREVSVPMLPEDNGALGGEDFIANATIITFPSNSTLGTVACTGVPLINDQKFELIEDFIFSVDLNSVESFINVPLPTAAIVDIYDDDGMCMYSVNTVF